MMLDYFLFLFYYIGFALIQTPELMIYLYQMTKAWASKKTCPLASTNAPADQADGYENVVSVQQARESDHSKNRLNIHELKDIIQDMTKEIFVLTGEVNNLSKRVNKIDKSKA